MAGWLRNVLKEEVMTVDTQKIKAIIAEQLGVKLEEVTDQAKFVEDLGADSLDTVELVMALEDFFKALFLYVL